MNEADFQFEVSDGVALLTLNRPAKLNAFSAEMGRGLEEAYRRCDEDDDIGAVVLTGAGRAFCAGADLSGGAETFAQLEEGSFSAAAISFPAFRVRKLVIAAVNGHAIGLGLTLALQCDVRLFAREGKYGIVQVRRGVLPDAYSHWTLPRLVGLARAADILLTGRTFDGEEAAALGIASRVLPAAEVLPAALELARDVVANASPLSVAVSKQLLWQSFALSADEVEARETSLHHHLMGRGDAMEGPMAHLEKRTPRWTSRVCKDWPK